MQLDQDTIEKFPFFFTPFNTKLIQQISHLAEFGSNIIVVEGAEGVGKTRFSYELISHFSKSQSASIYIHVDVSSFDDSHAFLSALCQKLGVLRTEDIENDIGENLAALRRFVQLMIREHKLAVVIIDSADSIEPNVLSALLSVIQTGAEMSYGLHFVFFALPDFTQRIDGLCPIDAAVHDFQLVAFTEEELERFVNERYSPQNIFADDAITPRSLWVRSQGILGVACDIIDSELSEREVQTTGFIDFGIIKMPIVHLSVLALLLAILIWMFISRLGSDSAHESVESKRDVIAIDHAAFIATPLPKLLQTQTPLPISNTLNKPTVVGPGVDVVTEEISTTDDVINNTSPASDSKKVSLTTHASENQQQVTPKAIKEVKEVKKVSPIPEPAEVKRAYSDDERFLLSLPPSSYALQVLAAGQIESLQNYVASQDNKQQLYIYQGLRKGKRWYMVVLAPYTSKDEATSAIKLLPEKQAKAGPWPKKISSVQSEIKTLK